jgi:hypothetical protein
MAVGFPHTNSYTTTGTTSVAVIPAPISGVAHIATRVSVYNADTVAHTYTLRRTVSGSTHYPLQKNTSTLAAGGTFTFDQVPGHSADGTTVTFTLVVDANFTTTESVVTASYIENS